MEDIFQHLAYGLWILVKFIGLAFLSILTLSASILINAIAIAYMKPWLPVPGFLFTHSGSTFLSSLLHLIGIGAY